jgi:hypothetical protein
LLSGLSKSRDGGFGGHDEPKRSLESVAAERARWEELLERLRRFAHGRDRSERYARELHARIVEQHGADPRFAAVLSALAAYRSKHDQQTAAQACRDAIAAVERDVDGVRFPWQDIPEASRGEWRAAFADPRSGWRIENRCPVCGATALRRYVRAHGAGRGGVWAWCGSCFAYEHGSVRVDAGTLAAPELDRVPMELLEHSPEFLERALRLAAGTAP